MWRVYWSKSVEKDMDKLPEYILQKFRSWVIAVEKDGLLNVRKLKGFHDESLRGNRHGQRSVRLNRSYRVIYYEQTGGQIYIVQVLEINKHEY